VNRRIDAMEPGATAKAEELFGETWPKEDGAARSMGREFARLVEDGEFPKLKYDHTDDHNHHVYRRIN